MSALPNVALPSNGVFGAPPSYAQPPPPPPPSCSGALGCLWNAVSGIAETLTGLVTAAWNAAVAVATYFEEAASGLVHLAEDAVAATAKALEKVGQALAAALRALLTFVEAAMRALLQAAYSAIQASLSPEVTALTSDFGAIVSAEQSGNPITLQTVSPFWTDVALLALILVAVSTAIVVASTIAADLSVGGDVLETVALSVVAAGVSVLLATLATGVLTQMAAGGTAAIQAIEHYVAGVASGQGAGPLVAHAPAATSCDYTHTFKGALDAYGLMTDYIGAKAAIGAILTILALGKVGVPLKNNVASGTVILLALALLGGVFDFLSLGVGTHEEQLAFSVLGTILGAITFFNSLSSSPPIPFIPTKLSLAAKLIGAGAIGTGVTGIIIDVTTNCPGS